MIKNLFNWTYGYDNGSFTVIPDEPTEIPHTLFKLYSLSDYSIDALLKTYVYAPHPWSFNDLFDCNEELLTFDDPKILKHLFENEPSTKDEFKELYSPDMVIQAQRWFMQLMYRQIGILSMTNISDNMLMWSYYCNHKGYAIEFDIKRFPFRFHGPFPVNYVSEIKSLSIKDVGLPIGLLAQSNIKVIDWKHEKEWRLLIQSPDPKGMKSPHLRELKDLGGHDRKFQYPIEAIKSISLGNRFFDPDEIRPINDYKLEINLLSDQARKIALLNFLIKNKITTMMALRKNLSQLTFRPVSIFRSKENQFQIEAVN